MFPVDKEEYNIRSWIYDIIDNNDDFPFIIDFSINFHTILHSGELLCILFNCLVHNNYIKEISKSNIASKQKENINNYISACLNLKKFKPNLIFTIQDLYESDNMELILKHLSFLYKLSKKYNNNLSSLLKEKPLPFLRSASSRVFQIPSSDCLDNCINNGNNENNKKTKKLERKALIWLLEFFEKYEEYLSQAYSILLNPSISLHELLSSCELLCEMVNIIYFLIKGKEEYIKINHSNIEFLCMENFDAYCNCLQELGIDSSNIIQSSDIFIKNDIYSISNHLIYIANFIEQNIPNYDGPIIQNTESNINNQLESNNSINNTTIEDNNNKKKDNNDNISLTNEQLEILEWINIKISNIGTYIHEPITSYYELRTGEILLQLLALLTKQTNILDKAELKPTLESQYTHNAIIVLNYLRDMTYSEITNCDTKDIISGDINALYSLLCLMRDKFDIDYLFINVLNSSREDPEKEITFFDLKADDSSTTTQKKKKGSRTRKSRSKIKQSKKRSKSRPRKSRSLSRKHQSAISKNTKRKVNKTVKVRRGRSKERPMPTFTKFERVTPNKKSPLIPTRRNIIGAYNKSPGPSPRRLIVRKDSILDKNIEIETIRKAQLQVREKIIKELYNTEKTYVENLDLVCSGLLKDVKESCVLPSDDLDLIFCNLEEILENHKKLLEILKECIDNYTDSISIAQVFLDNSKFFKIYAPYLENYSKGTIMIYHISERNTIFSDMVKDWEKLPNVTLNQLSSYLVMPIQRIPRYILLFKDMMKYTPTLHNDYTVFPILIETIENTLNTLNLKIDKEFDYQCSVLLAAVEAIDGDDAKMLIKINRKLILRGNIKVKFGHKVLRNLKNRKVHGLLFNDCFVITSIYDVPKNNKKYNYETRFNTDSMEIDDVAEDHISFKSLQGNFSIYPKDKPDIVQWLAQFHNVLFINK